MNREISEQNVVAVEMPTAEIGEWKGEPVQNLENTYSIRSASTNEKTFVFAKTKVYGHEIVYRRVGKMTEELVIDDTVYVECECKKSLIKALQPHEMKAVLDGHIYMVGVNGNNYIAVDNVQVLTTARMN